MKFVPRMRLNGRRTSEIQIVQEISDMIHGTGSRPYPIPVTEVAKMLGVSRGTIYSYIKRMKNITKSNTGRFILPKIPSEKKFRQFNKDHPITSEPLVAEWIDDLITRKGGEPLKNWKVRLRSLESVCNTCVIPRSDLINFTCSSFNVMNETNKLIEQVMPKFREEWLNRENMTIQESLPLVDDFCCEQKMQGKPFAKFEVIFIQHLLGPFIPRIKSMKNCGLDPKHSWIVDIPYSTNKTVYKKLLDEMDFNDKQILDTLTEPFNPYGVTQLGRVEYVLKEIAKQENGRPILAIDDGGWIIRELVRQNDEDPAVVKILSDRGFFLVEQTTKGHRIFEDMPAAKELIEKFEIPVISIAKAKTKKIVEMPFIGESIGFATKEKLEKLDRVDKNLGSILVIGYGPVGKSTAMSLKGICSQNEKIHVFDTEQNKKDEIENDGFVSLAEIDEKMGYFDAVFGCTGYRSFNVKDTSILRDDAILSSGSSATIEFNRREFLELSNHPNSKIHVLNREYTRKSGLHSDISLTDHNKKFTFLNGSFPINFQPEYLECVPHWIIQSTHALLIAGANEVIKIDKNYCRQNKEWFFNLNVEDDNWILEKSLEKLKEKI